MKKILIFLFTIFLIFNFTSIVLLAQEDEEEIAPDRIEAKTPDAKKPAKPDKSSKIKDADIRELMIKMLEEIDEEDIEDDEIGIELIIKKKYTRQALRAKKTSTWGFLGQFGGGSFGCVGVYIPVAKKFRLEILGGIGRMQTKGTITTDIDGEIKTNKDYESNLNYTTGTIYSDIDKRYGETDALVFMTKLKYFFAEWSIFNLFGGVTASYANNGPWANDEYDDKDSNPHPYNDNNDGDEDIETEHRVAFGLSFGTELDILRIIDSTFFEPFIEANPVYDFDSGEIALKIAAGLRF